MVKNIHKRKKEIVEKDKKEEAQMEAEETLTESIMTLKTLEQSLVEWQKSVNLPSFGYSRKIKKQKTLKLHNNTAYVSIQKKG